MSEQPEPPTDLAEVIANALREDIGSGDVTARLLRADREVEATVVCRETAVICGHQWFEAVFEQLGGGVEIEWLAPEGQQLRPDHEVCRLSGPAQTILTGERTALNFLQLMSGTATQTRRFVERIRGTDAKIIDTRKTLPGLRSAQRYAVSCGGGMNHRFGLFDAILIKENHILAAGGITEAIIAARELQAGVPLMCEAEDLTEVQAALDQNVDVLLLDDFATHLLAKAVNMGREYRRYNRAQTILEATGGISIDNVRSIADTGVDRISIGGLTKHAHAVDLSLRVHGDGALKQRGATVQALRVSLR